MTSFLYVFLGGGLGSICRYGISRFWDSSHLFYGTLMANVISCLILGILIGMNAEHLLKSHQKMLLMTGFCGGFSTFSTFSGEIVQLYQGGQIMTAGGYIIGSIVAGVVCILIGMFVARTFIVGLN